MPAKSIAPLIKELEKAWDLLTDEFVTKPDILGENPKKYNLWYYDKKGVVFTRPIITIQSQGTRKATSWYKRDAWDSQSATALNVLTTAPNTNNGNRQNPTVSTDEVCITAESLDRPIEEILTDLTHEMVHHLFTVLNYNWDFGADKKYHTMNFARWAEYYFGMYFDKASNGWTQLLDVNEEHKKAIKAVVAQLNTKVFDMFRNQQASTSKSGSSLKKWTCGTGCTTIRVSRDMVNITCDDCGEKFYYADKDVKTWWGKRQHAFSPSADCKYETIEDIQVPVSSSECTVCDRGWEGYKSHWSHEYFPQFPHNDQYCIKTKKAA